MRCVPVTSTTTTSLREKVGIPRLVRFVLDSSSSHLSGSGCVCAHLSRCCGSRPGTRRAESPPRSPGSPCRSALQHPNSAVHLGYVSLGSFAHQGDLAQRVFLTSDRRIRGSDVKNTPCELFLVCKTHFLNENTDSGCWLSKNSDILRSL